MSELIEVWRSVEIDGEKWPYEISNKGRIKSLGRLVDTKGNSKRLVKERILKLQEDSSGYQFVNLHYKGNSKTCWIHTLVCTVFHGYRPSLKHQVRHFPDSDLTNNNVDNLSWGTAEEQYKDRIIHNTDNLGKRNGRAKLTEKDIIMIREYIKEGLINIAIGKKFGVTGGTIRSIRNNRTWRHVCPR